MANHFSPRPVFLITFLIASSLLTSARDIPPRDISLVREPDENYYLVKKSPAVIICQAKNAAEIVFSCMGTQIPPTSVEVKDVSDIDPELTQAEIEVTQADLQNLQGQSPFWCECSAVDVDGQVAVTSRRATVSVAYLKNKFASQPKSSTVTVGDEVQFDCGAPEGLPKPEIVWRKDKKRLEIENNPRLSVTEKGSLIIQFVMPEDKGNYQCVARNVAGRRESEEALLSVTALAESAEPDLEISEGGNSGKKSSGHGKLRATRQSVKTYFTVEPQENYFITEEKPVVINCVTVAADILTFSCNGKRMLRERQSNTQGLDADGNRIIQAQLNITYADVLAYLSEFSDIRPYQCHCTAWYRNLGGPNVWDQLDSREKHGYVHLAHIDEAFQAEPTDTIAGINTDATLICEPPKGQPSPWVQWYKDDILLDLRGSDKYYVNAKGHLTIRNVQYDDAGSYNCVAENLVASRKSRAGTLTVSDSPVIITTASPPEDEVPTFPSVIPTKPVFLRDFEAENVLGPDGTKTVVCAVVAADQVTIDCGGSRLAVEEYELKKNQDSETGKRLLYVKAVITAEKLASNPDDYFCQCTAWYLDENQAWQRLTSAKGHIRQGVEPAFIGDVFKTSPVDTDAYFETEAQLVCQPPDGKPTPTVHWLKDGVRIDTEADPNFVVTDEGLFIEYVRVTDEGQYTCVAENEAGQRASQPIQFTVLGKPEPPSEATSTEAPVAGSETMSKDDGPVFSQDLEQEYYIVDDEAVTLECSVLEFKTVLFVCNGVILQETATTGYNFLDPIVNENVRTNLLTITREQVDEYEGAEPYTCLCRVFYQKDNARSTADSSSATIHVAYMQDNFRVEPSDTEVTFMGRLELQCQPPDAVPEPTISWLKDDQPVIEDERITVDSGTLIIESFNVDDEGVYSCLANNSFTNRKSRGAFVAFSVTGGPDVVTEPYTKPEFKTDEPEQTSSEMGGQHPDVRYISKDLHNVYYLVKNKPVTLTCEVYNVQSISFICGMQPVQNPVVKERQESFSTHDGSESTISVIEASINVSKAEVEDLEEGKDYWCQCFGHYRVPGIEEDQKLMSIKGYVEIAHLKKNFMKEPENQTVMEGDSLSIQCQPPAGNPPPKVSWTKDGESFEALSITPTGVLLIPEAQQEHAGEYICIAENEAGKRQSQAIYVNVKGKSGSMPAKGSIEGNECAKMLSSCSNLLPRNANHVSYCEAVTDYSVCVDNYFKKCTGIINEISMNAVKMAHEDTLKKCTKQPMCKQLQECKTISSNSPDTTMEHKGLSVHNLCRDTNKFLQCIDQNLAGCNVTISSPEEDIRGSLLDVDEWFQQFCDAFDMKIKDSNCDEIDSCSLQIEELAADNSTYWCNIISSLLECTSNVANICGIEMDQDLTTLQDRANRQHCSDGSTGLGPVTESEPTGEQGSSEVKSEPPSTEDGDGDDGDDQENNKNTEGGAAASKDDDNGSAVLRSSIFLATFLQLLILASVSWR
ncbi:hypothetical protein BsWGS_18759 [Bradybaena similaris]